MNTHYCKPARTDRRAGFTLLEVVLTLSMSVVLMVMIGGAIRFYGRDMDLRNMDIRQTQLAASILQMIENDLRSTVHAEPTDTAPLADLLASVSGGDLTQEDLSAAGIESTGVTDTESLADDGVSDSLALQEDPTILKTPGLIGDASQIQMDLSHLPRLEEYTQWINDNAADFDDVPSDLKTVAYFVQPDGISGGVQDRLSSLAQPTNSSSLGPLKDGGLKNGGLVRRSLDRSASTYAAVTGGITKLLQTGDLIAPEVTSIEFSYWDGLTWLNAWSSDQYGELPLAVQVRLTMKDLTSADPDATRTFRHTVGLLMARRIEETETTTDTSATESAQ